MKTRVLAGVVCLPVLFVIMFWAPPIFFTILVAIICAVSAIELIQAAGMPKNLRVRIYVVLSAILIIFTAHYRWQALVFWRGSWDFWHGVFWWSYLPYFFPILITCLMFLEAAIAYKSERQISIGLVFATIFGAAIMPHMLSPLISIRFSHDGRYFLLIPIICAFFTDAGAYFSGYLFGKRKAFPHISPNKTVAGCVGGLITGALLLTIYSFLINFATEYHYYFLGLRLAIIGVVGAAFTQLGDLVFSLIKREYNVKDFGKLIPGHGGMLDRFDSLFFATPVIYLMFYVLATRM